MNQRSGLLFAVTIAAVMVVSGCRCPSCEKRPELASGVRLPSGFCVLKGLTDADYDDEGWPRYIVSTKDGSVMALVTNKRYVMGSPSEPNESPPHRVTVERFYIDLFEVNNVQFDRFVRELRTVIPVPVMWCSAGVVLGGLIPVPMVWTDHPQLGDELLSTETSSVWLCRNWQPSFAECLQSHPSHTATYVQMDPDYFKEYWRAGVNDTHPARAVSFWEAWHYCRWVGKDLPTEAEWELAATGGHRRLYPWGNTEPDSQRLLCNYGGDRAGEDGFEYTAPVSAFGGGRSPVGCHNMAGNVWEWCKDKYDATIYSGADFAGGKGSKSEYDRQMTNPKGAVFGDERVLRGGSYTSDIYDCRTTSRQACRPNFHGMNIGFRGVLRIR